jgi:hypothetical protein
MDSTSRLCGYDISPQALEMCKKSRARIIARRQQVVRADREKPQPLSDELQTPCIEKKSARFFRKSAESFSKITERDSFSNALWMLRQTES